MLYYIRKQALIPAAFSVISLMLCVVFLLFSRHRYEATMLIGPVADRSSNQQSGLRALAGQIGGLNLGSLGAFGTPRDSQLELLIEIVKTPDVGHILEQKFGIYRDLFSSQWDENAKKWKPPSGFWYEIKHDIKRFLVDITGNIDDSNDGVPTDQDYAREMGRIFEATPIRTTGLYNLSLSAETPEKAARLLEIIILGGDEFLRERAQIRHHVYIAYLTDRLGSETNLILKSAMTNILLDEEQAEMIGGSKLPYSADIIQEAVGNHIPIGLSYRLILVIWVVVGGGIGTAVTAYRRQL